MVNPTDNYQASIKGIKGVLSIKGGFITKRYTNDL